MGYSEDLVKELKGVGKISPGAADSFSREFNRIVTVAEETLNRGQVDSAYIRSSTIHFGRTLEAVFRYSLWEALIGEAEMMARGLTVRGLSGTLDSFLKTWIMAIMSAVGSPEVYELAGVLEILRARAELIESSAAEEEADSAAECDRDFMEYILAGRSSEAADRALSVYRQTGSLESTLSGVFYASLAEIGRRWRENVIGVAEEHAATSALRAAARAFFNSISRDSEFDLSAAVICVPGDEHELGAEIISLYLSSRGWKIYFVGRSLPEQEVIREVGRGGYDAILLSVSMVRHLPAFEKLVREIRERYPRVFIIAGGSALAAGSEVMRKAADDVAATPDQAHRILLKLGDGSA